MVKKEKLSSLFMAIDSSFSKKKKIYIGFVKYGGTCLEML